MEAQPISFSCFSKNHQEANFIFWQEWKSCGRGCCTANYRGRPVYRTFYILVVICFWQKTYYILVVLYTGWIEHIFSADVYKIQYFLCKCIFAKIFYISKRWKYVFVFFVSSKLPNLQLIQFLISGTVFKMRIPTSI